MSGSIKWSDGDKGHAVSTIFNKSRLQNTKFLSEIDGLKEALDAIIREIVKKLSSELANDKQASDGLTSLVKACTKKGVSESVAIAAFSVQPLTQAYVNIVNCKEYKSRIDKLVENGADRTKTSNETTVIILKDNVFFKATATLNGKQFCRTHSVSSVSSVSKDLSNYIADDYFSSDNDRRSSSRSSSFFAPDSRTSCLSHDEVDCSRRPESENSDSTGSQSPRVPGN